MNVSTRLLLFFFITIAGSTLSSIASFLSIEKYFGDVAYLGLALSLKTAASFLFTYRVSQLIRKLGTAASFFASQIFGLISLVFLQVGFLRGNFPLVVFGLVVNGLPTTLMVVLLVATLRSLSGDGDHFRKLSGTRELLFGIAMLFSALAAPILLSRYSLGSVYAIDAVSFVLGLLILAAIRFPMHLDADARVSPLPLRHLLKAESARKFLCVTSASLLLAGLVPLFASSKSIALTRDLPLQLRESMWGIEALTIILSSSLYVWLRNHAGLDRLGVLSIISGTFLFPGIAYQRAFVVLIIATMISLAVNFSFLKFRDDFVLAAGSDPILVKNHSALSLLQKNVVYTISPLLLSSCFRLFQIKTVCIVILCIQMMFLMPSLRMQRASRRSI